MTSKAIQKKIPGLFVALLVGLRLFDPFPQDVLISSLSNEGSNSCPVVTVATEKNTGEAAALNQARRPGFHPSAGQPNVLKSDLRLLHLLRCLISWTGPHIYLLRS